MQYKCTEYPIMCHTYKGGPIDRANRHTKPRHRRTQKRTHLSVTRPKAVAKGDKVGLAEPLVRPNLDWHQSRCVLAGDSPLSSQRRLLMFSYLRMAGINLSSYKRASTHPSQVILHSIHIHIQVGEVVVGIPLVSLE